MTVSQERDAFGQALLDHLRGREGVNEIIERSDGLIGLSQGAAHYFSGYEEWDPLDRAAADLARGRVLDVGCGAGRFALHLQDRGHEVVGIDPSPGAVETCLLRGVRDARIMALAEVGAELGPFDTILMMGKNLALLGTPRDAKRALAGLATALAPGGRLVGVNLDPTQTDDSDHLAYQAQNRVRGLPPGQLRLRVRYRTVKGPWFDYLFLAPDELRALLEGTGWHMADLSFEEPRYLAVLERETG